MENKHRKPQQEKTPKKLSQILPQEGKGEILSDVNGSYTGTPFDSVQTFEDADVL